MTVAAFFEVSSSKLLDLREAPRIRLNRFFLLRYLGEGFGIFGSLLPDGSQLGERGVRCMAADGATDYETQPLVRCSELQEVRGCVCAACCMHVHCVLRSWLTF